MSLAFVSIGHTVFPDVQIADGRLCLGFWFRRITPQYRMTKYESYLNHVTQSLTTG